MTGTGLLTGAGGARALALTVVGFALGALLAVALLPLLLPPVVPKVNLLGTFISNFAGTLQLVLAVKQNKEQAAHNPKLVLFAFPSIISC